MINFLGNEELFDEAIAGLEIMIAEYHGQEMQWSHIGGIRDKTWYLRGSGGQVSVTASFDSGGFPFIGLEEINLTIYEGPRPTSEEKSRFYGASIKGEEIPQELWDKCTGPREYQTLKWRGNYTWRSYVHNTTTMAENPAKQDVIVGKLFMLAYECIKDSAQQHIDESVRFTTPSHLASA